MIDIFSPNLKRSELLRYSKNLPHSPNITINIHRNHAFEPISSVIAPFLHLSGLCAKFNLSSYDDSLSFENLTPSNLELLWLDLSRYKGNFIPYLQERLEYLRHLSQAPILVILMDMQVSKQYHLTQTIANCEVLYVSQLLHFNSMQILDEVKSSITGTRLSNMACLQLAQILGLSLIPSFILPSLKAIVLDLDNTLYSGILGEDGIKNLLLTQAHKDLQDKMLEYKHKGFLLALASKNDYEDVKAMFRQRDDFPLQLSDFDCIKADWNPKSDNLIAIAKYFNIGLDSMLFIDDNPAEIQNTKHLGTKSILASSPSEVLRILELFPQMRKMTFSKEDTLRANDILANTKRKELENLTQEEYFSNLAIKLEFSLNDKANLTRITELLNKTNQFIANYTRPTNEKVRFYLENRDNVIVSIAMRDKLSDSGNIAIFIGKKGDKKLELIDMVISCRALGRRLESIMIYQALKFMSERLGLDSKRVLIHYQKGERNMPFLQTLSNLSGYDVKYLESHQCVEIAIKEVDMKGLEIIQSL